MLSDELMQLAATRIQIELAERRERFGQEIQQIISEMTLQGLGRSGAVVERTVQAIAREFDIRAMLMRQVLSRVMSRASLSFDAQLSRQIKQQIERHLDAECRIWPVNISGFLTPYPSPGRFHHLTTCVRKRWRKSGQRSTFRYSR
jgi:hypothetical protein